MFFDNCANIIPINVDIHTLFKLCTVNSRFPACLGNVRLASSDSAKLRATQVDNKDVLATSEEKSHQKQMDGYITVDAKVNITQNLVLYITYKYIYIKRKVIKSQFFNRSTFLLSLESLPIT